MVESRSPVKMIARVLENLKEPEKRNFIILLLLTCGAMVVAAIFLYLIPYIGFSNIHPRLPLIMAIGFLLVVMFMIGGALTLVFTILRGKNLFFNRWIRGVVIRLLFPTLFDYKISKKTLRFSSITLDKTEKIC